MTDQSPSVAEFSVAASSVSTQGRPKPGLTQDIKMGSCVFTCNISRRWIIQQQVDPVSVYCDGVGCRVLCLYSVTGWGVMSCVCGMAFLCGSTLVKVPLLQPGIVAV